MLHQDFPKTPSTRRTSYQDTRSTWRARLWRPSVQHGDTYHRRLYILLEPEIELQERSRNHSRTTHFISWMCIFYREEPRGTEASTLFSSSFPLNIYLYIYISILIYLPIYTQVLLTTLPLKMGKKHREAPSCYINLKTIFLINP
jgi:hypothetical protein